MAVMMLTIKGLVITTGGTSYGRLVNYTGNVTNISLLDNTFNGVAGTSTSSYFAGIYYTSPTEAKGVWHVEGNTMNNISYGVYVYGSSYTTSMDSIFIENNVINTTYYGLYPRYAKYEKVHGNTVNSVEAPRNRVQLHVLSLCMAWTSRTTTMN